MAVYNPYNPNYIMQEWQSMKDRIDKNMQNYQQVQNQFMQPQQQQSIPQPQIHQSFQLAPQNSFSEIQAKYVSDINDVKNTFVMSLGMFLNKEMTTLWLKNINGEIRTFSLNEIIEQDEKDKEIDSLRKQLDEMRTLLFQKNERQPEVYEVEEIKPEKKTTKKKEA